MEESARFKEQTEVLTLAKVEIAYLDRAGADIRLVMLEIADGLMTDLNYLHWYNWLCI